MYCLSRLQVACKQWNDLEGWEYSKTANRGSYENPPRLSPQTWTRIKFTEYEGTDGFRWLFLKQGCMHCGDPACVRSCPTTALKQQSDGRITVEPDLCNGCGYCTQFCPFNVPQLEVSSLLTGRAKVSKCNFCQDRTDNNQIPACVKTCPAQALSWGDRDKMIAAGKNAGNSGSQSVIINNQSLPSGAFQGTIWWQNLLMECRFNCDRGKSCGKRKAEGYPCS
jgi:formate dehydrogenase iron-sulfur subunit